MRFANPNGPDVFATLAKRWGLDKILSPEEWSYLLGISMEMLNDVLRGGGLHVVRRGRAGKDGFELEEMARVVRDRQLFLRFNPAAPAELEALWHAEQYPYREAERTRRADDAFDDDVIGGASFHGGGSLGNEPRRSLPFRRSDLGPEAPREMFDH